MAVLDEIKIRELSLVNSVKLSDYLIVEKEDGTKRIEVSTLERLFSQAKFFNNVQEMINSDLNAGDLCMTFGYYEVEDGGSAWYYIDDNPKNTADELCKLTVFSDSSLVAKLLISDVMYVEQFGAKGDGESDDTTTIKLAIEKCNGNKLLFKGESKYKLTDTVTLTENCNIDFNNCTLIPYSCSAITLNTKMNRANNFGSVVIDAENYGNAIVLNGDGCYSSFDNFTVKNIVKSVYAIRINGGTNMTFNNVILESANAVDGVDGGYGIFITGIETLVPNNITFNNIQFNNLVTDIQVDRGMNNYGNFTFNNVKAYNSVSSFTDSVIAKVYGNCNLVLKNVVSTGLDKIVSTGISSPNVEIDGLFITNPTNKTCKAIENSSSTARVSLRGKITLVNKNSSTGSGVLVSKNTGTIFVNTMDITEDNFTGIYATSKAEFSTNYIGKVISSGLNFSKFKSATDNGNIYTNYDILNMVIDWNGTDDLSIINHVMDGQLLYIISSSGKTINTDVDESNIILKNMVTKNLSSYDGVLLRSLNGKLIEI